MKLNVVERGILLLFLSGPLGALTSALIDKSVLIYSSGEFTWVSRSNVSKDVNIIFVILNILNLFIGLVSRPKAKSQDRKPFIRAVALMMAYFMGVSFLISHNGWSVGQILGHLIFLCYLIFFSGDRIGKDFVIVFRRMILFVILSIVLFAIYNPGRSFRSCRLVKCTFNGNLFTSYFPHENYLGLFMICVLPFYVLWETKRARFFLFGASSILGIMSGSRMVLFALLFFILINLVHDKLIKIIPLVSFFISTWLFVFLRNSDALTQRGSIYEALRGQLSGHWFFGVGFDALSKIDSAGVKFKIFHEHGAGGSFLFRFGVVGWLLFTLILVYFIIKGDQIGRTAKIAMAIFSVSFVTETICQFTVLNTFSWIYLICLNYPLEPIFNAKKWKLMGKADSVDRRKVRTRGKEK